MSTTFELSDICAEQDPTSADQRRRLVALLKAGADIHATDKNGVTALHHAVRFRSLTAVKTLIAHGANVDQVCRRSGSTLCVTPALELMPLPAAGEPQLRPGAR